MVILLQRSFEYHQKQIFLVHVRIFFLDLIEAKAYQKPLHACFSYLVKLTQFQPDGKIVIY